MPGRGVPLGRCVRASAPPDSRAARAPSCMTCGVKATRCMSATRRTGSSCRGECRNNSELADVCRVYLTGGGSVRCRDGYYRRERACPVVGEAGNATCLNGDLPRCREDRFMMTAGDCRPKGDVVGCAGDVSTECRCPACVAGRFLQDRVCACARSFVGARHARAAVHGVLGRRTSCRQRPSSCVEIDFLLSMKSCFQSQSFLFSILRR